MGRPGATEIAMDPYDALGGWIDAHHAAQIDFLREIVRVPSDTPPGDNAPAAEKAASAMAVRRLRSMRTAMWFHPATVGRSRPTKA